MEVELRLATLMPAEGLKLMLDVLARFVPLMTKATVAPCVPAAGDKELKEGAFEVTVNDRDPLVPFGVVTDTSCGPRVAPDAIVTVAVTCVAVELTLVTLMPVDGLKLRLEALARLFPLIVRDTAVPCVPVLGLSAVMTGSVVLIGSSIATIRPPT